MTWVKICGITNLEDAITAVEAGADAVGFVFYEKSPRYVTPDAVGEIVAELPESVAKVGVFVYDGADKATQVVDQCGLTDIQIHLRLPFPTTTSDPLAAVASSRRTPFFLAMPAAWWVPDGPVHMHLSSFLARPEQAFNRILLDSGNAGQPGGTGETFDWHRLAGTIREMSQDTKVIVAGGLTPSNVGEAIKTLTPWGVDVSSGVEQKPGKKDPQKVRSFIAAARGA
jgi:phosphoribosylanthranilate isomerase